MAVRLKALPTRDDLGGLPSARTGRPIATYDVTPIYEGAARQGQALSRAGAEIGGAISALGNRMEAEKEQRERNKAEMAFQEFRWNEAKAFDERLRNVGPGEAAGLADTWAKEYKGRADQFARTTLPADGPVREAYDRKLFATERTFTGQALDFQRKEQSRFAKIELDEHANKVVLPQANEAGRAGGQVADRYRQFDAVVAQQNALIDANPDLSAIEKDTEKRKFRAEAERSWLDGLHPRERGEVVMGGGDEKTETTAAIDDDTVSFFAGRSASADVDADRVRKMHPDFASRLKRAIADAEAATGAKAEITDTFRSVERQKRYHDAYRSGQGGLAAPPGRSRHQRGAAADIKRGPVLSWLHENAEKYGLEFLTGKAFAKDPVHIQLAGGVGASAGGGGMIQALPFDERMRIAKAADRELGVERTQYKSDANDYAAFLSNGGVPEAPAFTPEQNLLMLNEADAAELDDTMARAAQFGEKVRTVRDMSTDEIRELMRVERERLNTPEDFKQNSAEVAALAKAAEQEVAARLDNPAGYVLGTEEIPGNKSVTDAYANMVEAYGDTGGARNIAPGDLVSLTDRYANASLTEQARLGLFPEQRRILTPQLRNAITRQFNAQESGGQNAAQVLQMLAGQWGKHGPQVFKEIGKDLPGVVEVIGAMPPGRAAESLAEAAVIGRDALKEGFETKVVSDLEDQVGVTVREEFGASLPANGSGIATENKVKDAVSLLSLFYMRNGETDPERAASRAYDDVIGQKYHFVGDGSNRDRKFRVPKDLNIQPNAIAQGAQKMLANLGEASEGAKRLDLETLVLPSSRRFEGDPEGLRLAYQRHLKQRAYWVTAGNEEGLALYDPDARAFVQWTDNGRAVPVVIDWDNLSRASRLFPAIPGMRDLPGIEADSP